MNGESPILRVGQGWDVHRLVPGGPLRLAGIDIPFDKHALGHSDGDAALHATADAVLGAIAAGDIGSHFPDDDESLRSADSARFLKAAVELAAGGGFRVAQVDLTLLVERPRVGPHRDAMRARIADLVECDAERVSIKAKTGEGLGAVGRGEAIAALVLVALARR